MFCQIVDRKSVVPSSGYFWRQQVPSRPVDKIRNLKKKLLVKSDILFGWLGEVVHHYKSYSDFFGFQNIFFY